MRFKPSVPRSAFKRRVAALSALTTAAVGVMTSPASAAGNAPVPGFTQPPGTGGLTTMLSWAGWTVAFLCTVGILLVAGTMAVKHRRGEGGESLGALGWVLGACVLGAASGSVAGALI